jgi:transposase-like protein
MERALLEKESLKKDMAETEGARRASGVSAIGGASGPPDPEVPEKPKRRRFSAEYRLRIVREADACKEAGEIGALLRREGLYSSLLTAWRRQRDAGALEGLRSKKRGPKAKAVDPRVKRLEREVVRLRRQLEQAETIIDIQKKVAGILGIPLRTSESDEKD